MRVVVPADDVETREIIKNIAYIDGPFYVRLSREKFPRIFEPETYTFSFGKGHVLREGEDVTVVSNGVMSSFALLAAEELEREGISVEVVHMPWVKPIDWELIVKSASKTGAVVTAEEHSIIGGLGSAVAEVLVENCPVPMERLGTPDVFGRSGKGWELLDYFNLNDRGIIEKVKRVLARKEK